MYNLKYYTNELIYKIETDSQAYKIKLSITKQGKKG